MPPTLYIFSLPALEDLFLLPLSVFTWVFRFFSSLPVLECRSFWASYTPPFSLREITSSSFALLFVLILYNKQFNIQVFKVFYYTDLRNIFFKVPDTNVSDRV